jgi:hypothetical protein
LNYENYTIYDLSVQKNAANNSGRRLGYVKVIQGRKNREVFGSQLCKMII